MNFTGKCVKSALKYFSGEVKRKDTLFLNFYVLILYRERKVRREKKIHLFFHLFMHSLVDSCICPDWELNWQACCSGVML